MFQRDVSEVEVYAFEQKVGRDEDVGVAVADYRAVVADTFDCRGIDGGEAFGEAVR